MGGDAAPPWAAYVRVGRVRAVRLTEPTVWHTATGERLRAEPGDWLVSDGTGGPRSVTDASFRASHEHDHGDIWRRTARVLARPVTPGEEVLTQEGPTVSGLTGWVIRDQQGHEWIVPTEHFDATYRPATEEE